ncbi:MAG: dihydrodipicolinate synthase family protein [Pirellulales bacterium]|nr:dihydrodipicolinate synthase family protein [Pirellulales bacterium]
MKRYPCSIMATCCVPWDADGQLLEAVFRREIANMLAQGTSHLYIFGTAGEGYAVTERQFDRVVDVFADEMRKAAAEPMVGAISLSLPTVIERIARCRDRGITRFQISLPAWGALNDRELFDFFRQTCARFPDCQFLHYNLMRTKRLVSPAEYGRLAEEHPNLVATKNSTESIRTIQGLIEKAPQLQHFLTEIGYAYGSLLGECGLLASLVNSWPKLRQLFEAGRKRDVETLVSLQREIGEVLDGLFAVVGDEAHIDPAFDKIFARMHDPEFPLRLLPPYASAGEERYQRLVELFASRFPAWLPATQR